MTLRFAFICLVAGLTLGLLFGGCDSPEAFHKQPFAECQDVVIWNSPAQDCVNSGGVYETKEWPRGSGKQENVCNFCDTKPAQRCQQTSGDLYSYRCETPGYERCWTPTGAVKYANCEYMGIYCVASCSEVD